MRCRWLTEGIVEDVGGWKIVVAGDFGTESVPVLFVDPFSRKKSVKWGNIWSFILQNVTMFPVS